LYVSRENGGLTLQTNFNAGELRYVRNIPGGRRQLRPTAPLSSFSNRRRLICERTWINVASEFR
jgi:hypothetical protein